jgi:hypothetical protein
MHPLKYRTNYVLSWPDDKIKVTELIIRFPTQPISHFSDFSSVFYAFSKFTAITQARFTH